MPRGVLIRMDDVRQLIGRLWRSSVEIPPEPRDIAKRVIARYRQRRHAGEVWTEVVRPLLNEVAQASAHTPGRKVAEWRRIERAGELLSEAASDRREARLAEALVWGAAAAASLEEQQVTSETVVASDTRPCRFCHRTAFRQSKGIRLCRDYLPGKPGRKKLARMARHHGGESAWASVLTERVVQIRHQWRNNPNEGPQLSDLDRLAQKAEHLDPTPFPWWGAAWWNLSAAEDKRQAYLFGAMQLHQRYEAYRSLVREAERAARQNQSLGGAHGQKGGRPRNDNSAQIHRAEELIAAGKSMTEAAKIVGISVSTLSRRKREGSQRKT